MLTDTFDPDDATITIDGAHQPDASGDYYTPAGLLLDCLAVDLAMPGDVRSHVAQTCAKDGSRTTGGSTRRIGRIPTAGANISNWVTNPESSTGLLGV